MVIAFTCSLAMEVTYAFTFLGIGDVEVVTSKIDALPTLPIDDVSKKADAFLDEEGEKIHPIFRSETGSSQMLSSATTVYAFEYVMEPLISRLEFTCLLDAKD
jgi:hypothetical protein